MKYGRLQRRLKRHADDPSKVSLSLHKKSKKASTDPKREREEQTEKETIKAPKENSNAPKAGNPELGQYIVWCKHLGFSHNFEDVIQKFVSQKCGIYFKKKLKCLIVNFEIKTKKTILVLI